jgi:hypothetical protein
MRGRAVQRTRLVLCRDNGAGYRLNRKAMSSRKIWRQQQLAERKGATIEPITEYHRGELEIALAPSRSHSQLRRLTSTSRAWHSPSRIFQPRSAKRGW